MSAPTPIAVSSADSAVIDSFAAQAGIPGNQLITAVVAAFADHLRQHGSLTLPVRIGPPSPQCALCPVAQASHQPIMELPRNLIKGWPQ